MGVCDNLILFLCGVVNGLTEQHGVLESTQRAILTSYLIP